MHLCVGMSMDTPGGVEMAASQPTVLITGGWAIAVSADEGLSGCGEARERKPERSG